MELKWYQLKNFKKKLNIVGKFRIFCLFKGVDCCSDTSISFHRMNEHTLVKLNNLWEKYRKFQKNISYNLTYVLDDFVKN